MKRLIEYPLIEITWLDANSCDHHTAWGKMDTFMSEIEASEFTVRSVGYVIRESKTSLALAASLSLPNGVDEDAAEVSGTLIIPQCCVIERRSL